MTNNLTMRWVPVVDATGRTYMESVWISLPEVSAERPAPQESVTTHAA